MHRVVSVLVATLLTGSAMASGFQVTAQSARSMGMGLASTAVANDASAVFYNPGGLAFQQTGLVLGGLGATNLEGRYTGPSGVGEDQVDAISVLPQIYGTFAPGTIHYGLGVYTPFGLPMQWEDRDTFSGRHTSYLANIRTINLNPTVAFAPLPNLGVGLGVDWVHSKVQLERRGAFGTFDVLDAKLKSDLPDADGWGWNAGLLWKTGAWQVGTSYRSAIDVDHEPTLEITQILTGIPAIDAAVATQIPPVPLDAELPIELPASWNFGVAMTFGNNVVSAEADFTEWSSFQQLAVNVPSAPPFNVNRPTNWNDTWALRIGAELGCGTWKCRLGYYNDESPQPLADVGPVLPDADRDGFTAGLGIPVGGSWTLDIGYVHVMFDDRVTPLTTTDGLAGLWETTGSELAVNLRYH